MKYFLFTQRDTQIKTKAPKCYIEIYKHILKPVSPATLGKYAFKLILDLKAMEWSKSANQCSKPPKLSGELFNIYKNAS